jgi:sugar lactone lactonase YvrE
VEARVSCVFEARNRLGEGPCWDPATQRLYWFDIKRLRLFWLSHETGATGSWDLPMRASAAAVRAGGGLILATEQGLFDFDIAADALTLRHPIAMEPGFRTNDCKNDLAGRFWWSTMDDDGGRRPGKVFRYDPDGRLDEQVAAIAIANTVSVSPDGATFYLADSAEQTLYAYDLDEAGRLGGRRVFAHTRGQDGSPDGSAVDAEGFVWNAQWGAWRIVRYAPDGRIDRIVPMPVEQPSSCAFGGPDLTVLYITSALDGLSEEALAKQPLAGGLFRYEAGVKGLALPAFDG